MISITQRTLKMVHFYLTDKTAKIVNLKIIDPEVGYLFATGKSANSLAVKPSVMFNLLTYETMLSSAFGVR